MGVIYKLNLDIKGFILGEKKANPGLSCRNLASIVENKFQIKVSKSSINSMFKEAGLSMPIGRRQKKKRRKPTIAVEQIKEVQYEAPVEIKAEEPVEEATIEIEQVKQEAVLLPAYTQLDIPQSDTPIETLSEMPCTGAILLKAADCLIGGSYSITEAIKDRLNRHDRDLLAKTESLIYLPLFELPQEAQIKDFSGLWSLIDKKLSLDSILLYLNELQSFKAINTDIMRIFSTSLEEVRCVKVNFSDKSSLYLDGQMHTIWSTPYLPYDFSSTIYNIKSYINQSFQGDSPLVLFAAPGYDIPTKELFDFIVSLDTLEKQIVGFNLYSNKLEELEYIRLEQDKKRHFVFGLWPWQFGQYRRVKLGAGFRPLAFEAIEGNLYIAEAEVELLQPTLNIKVILKGCALKTNPEEKVRLIILTNAPFNTISLEELACLYLGHWPNLEESFQDLGRKIELFTYTASSQRFFSTDSLYLDKENDQDIRMLFKYYLRALDLYARWHFLPSGYEDSDFPTINERIYSLKANLKKLKNHILVTFQPPSGYPCIKELEYACRRVNEKEVIISEGRRLWLCSGNRFPLL